MNWKRVKAIVCKYIYVSQRDIFRIFDVFWWPTFQLFIWGLFSVYLQKASENSLNLISILLGAVILWMFFDRSSRDISIAIMDDLWNKNFVNLFSTPLSIAEYLTGIILVAIVKLALSAVIMAILAYVFYSFQIMRLGWYLIPAVFGLTIMGWTVSLLIQSIILRFGRNVEVFIWAAAILVQPFSCVFYPLTTLPSWAQKVALFLPSTYLFENMRNILFDRSISIEQLVFSLGLTVVYFACSIAFFYQTFNYAKNKGLLVKYY